MFYRRKVILALLQLTNGELEKLRLQKLLFLYNMRQSQPVYEFVPYKYGCYSYSAQADLNTMVKKKFLEENEKKYFKLDEKDYFFQLKEPDRLLMKDTVSLYGNMTRNELITHTYTKYPFYAINSTIAHQRLSKEELSRVKNSVPSQTQTVLFTLGYEGISLENYLLKLIENNISLLLDVRKNPLSMKFGFSKSRLKLCCNNLNIEYLHMPEVGIDSSKRQTLNTQDDYDSLFSDYRRTTLKDTVESQQKILDLLEKHHRVALTCFESKPCECHRTHLAENIEQHSKFNYPLVHL